MQKIIQKEQGFTLSELLVTLLISTIVFAGLISQYSLSVHESYDQGVRISTVLQAQATLQMVGSELRMLGNGVPFDQANFQIGESTLADPTVTEPIQVSSAAANTITFRINETGDVFLLMADFDPSASLVVSLTDVSSLDPNDPIYISNSVVSGEDGLYGVIDTVDTGANTVTLKAGYIASPAATFDMGSILEEVPLVTYASPAGGVTRDSGFGAVELGSGSTLTLDYQDVNGVSLGIPFTNIDVVNSLRAITVTINQQSERKLRSGEYYYSIVSQTFGLRNLNYLY
ncbi:prepilin-type N-terminal cleavage/methylation domain-containing protein [Oligoflexia bacterium]|nr:prepilin-type N-terminal cleavage/methylation domain-containing protein [Oligoflexia bacterium]